MAATPHPMRDEGERVPDPMTLLRRIVEARVPVRLILRAADNPAFQSTEWHLEIDAGAEGKLWLETGLTTARGRQLGPDVARALYRVAACFLRAGEVPTAFGLTHAEPRLRSSPPGVFVAAF